MSQIQLPTDFFSLMQQQWGSQVAEELCASLSTTDPSVSVRLNPAKAPVSALPYEQVPWCADGYYLPERPAFTFDPLLHAGAYYVQDASSMFLSHVVRQYVDRPVVALDLCAAPGGKSTLLHGCLPKGSLLVSNEPMRQRAQVLAENLTKWGSPYTVVSQNYPADFTSLSHLFDFIVTDVPCSGEGMFRKDEQAVRDWSLQNVDLCWHRQRDILESVWPTLKPGGLLVYSTCTFNRYEDEDNVQWIAGQLGAEVLQVSVGPEWNIHGEYHFLPGRIRGEGQYMALLRKNGEASA
ncbi:MAG: RsmB/NOP family class I SAM-dependent RNA methyltransferase, partial [Bacteroidaceae bacterium]|nr:RsmB/NOP family class I SAM-dependent RNA methyltransferase [Bacteroidaceae bacterium]